MSRGAAGVETGDNKSSVIFNNEEKRVGKTTQKTAMNRFEHKRKLSRVCAYALCYRVDRFAKASTQSATSLSYQSSA
jgi:hypothetical protein